jgi:hypothetical protein
MAAFSLIVDVEAELLLLSARVSLDFFFVAAFPPADALLRPLSPPPRYFSNK